MDSTSRGGRCRLAVPMQVRFRDPTRGCFLVRRCTLRARTFTLRTRCAHGGLGLSANLQHGVLLIAPGPAWLFNPLIHHFFWDILLFLFLWYSSVASRFKLSIPTLFVIGIIRHHSIDITHHSPHPRHMPPCLLAFHRYTRVWDVCVRAGGDNSTFTPLISRPFAPLTLPHRFIPVTTPTAELSSPLFVTTYLIPLNILWPLLTTVLASWCPRFLLADVEPLSNRYYDTYKTGLFSSASPCGTACYAHRCFHLLLYHSSPRWPLSFPSSLSSSIPGSSVFPPMGLC